MTIFFIWNKIYYFAYFVLTFFFCSFFRLLVLWYNAEDHICPELIYLSDSGTRSPEVNVGLQMGGNQKVRDPHSRQLELGLRHALAENVATHQSNTHNGHTHTSFLHSGHECRNVPEISTFKAGKGTRRSLICTQIEDRVFLSLSGSSDLPWP